MAYSRIRNSEFRFNHRVRYGLPSSPVWLTEYRNTYTYFFSLFSFPSESPHLTVVLGSSSLCIVHGWSWAGACYIDGAEPITAIQATNHYHSIIPENSRGYACHIQSSPINPIKDVNWIDIPAIRHGILAELALTNSWRPREGMWWNTAPLMYGIHALRPVFLIARNWRLVKENATRGWSRQEPKAECWSLQDVQSICSMEDKIG